MAWGWDPYLVMAMRASYGYTWVPSALQPAVQMAPGLATPGLIPYDPANPPSRFDSVCRRISRILSAVQSARDARAANPAE